MSASTVLYMLLASIAAITIANPAEARRAQRAKMENTATRSYSYGSGGHGSVSTGQGSGVSISVGSVTGDSRVAALIQILLLLFFHGGQNSDTGGSSGGHHGEHVPAHPGVHGGFQQGGSHPPGGNSPSRGGHHFGGKVHRGGRCRINYLCRRCLSFNSGVCVKYEYFCFKHPVGPFPNCECVRQQCCKSFLKQYKNW